MIYTQPQKPVRPVRAPSQASGLDITAFILAFLLPLIGAILGFTAIHEAHKHGRQAHGLATAGAVLGSLFSVIIIVVIIAVAASAPDAAQQYLNCIDGQLNGTVSQSTDCAAQYPPG